jgi:hypothetical protein
MGMTRFSSKWILSHSTWYKFRRSRHYHSHEVEGSCILQDTRGNKYLVYENEIESSLLADIKWENSK